jgi:epidermal growth factor receptor substrate 15
LVCLKFSSRTKGLRFILASNKGLLDDDDDDDAGPGVSTTINNHSAEIGNLQNQLQSTTRSLENTRTERSNVEATTHNQAVQLSSLQTQLSSAKAAYETESRLLASLRERYSNQSSEIQKVNEELIRAESDLSAIRVEKTEIEQGLLHDKEEIRELQRKMTETGSTIEVVKAEIEKAKKEAKHQKGLLVVAKKQLATREAEKAKASQELQEAAVEAQEATKEREIAEAALNKEATAISTSNGLPFAPSPSLSGDSTAQQLQGSPESPSSVSGSVTAKSNNPFERLAAGPGPQSPFLPFANSSVPTPPIVTSAQNEGTTTDNPFTFDQAFGDEEARPGLDVEEPSSGPERSVQPSSGKVVGEPRVAVNEEFSEPSSDHDLFTTPPTSALDTLGASAFTSPVEPDALKLPPPHATSPAPSTDRPPEAHTDLNSQLKELDANESDSSDEDETPLATLAGRSPPSNKVEVTKDAISNGHAMPQTTVEAVFPPIAAVDAATETQSANPFPPVPEKDSSPFPASTPPFAAAPEPQKVATLSDFDKAFSDFPGTTPTAAGNNLSFDNAFEDQFDFTKAEPSTSLPGISVSSSGSSAFPPAPTSSGIVKPAISPVRDTGFENAFKPQQNTASSARPVSAVDGLPVLPPVPESRPFSFVQAFSSDLSIAPAPTTTAAPTVTTPSQPPSAPDVPNPTLGDAFGLNGAQTDSAVGTASSRTSSIPLTQSPVSTVPASNPVRGSTSPRETVRFPVPVSQPSPASPPPKGRPSTSSSKESGKEHGTRVSKLSVSGHSPSPGIEKMTFVPIIDPSALWEEEEDAGLIASFKFPTFESDNR